MIQPIETRYAGCRFRSRLEARFAVLFDALRLDWEYEPEGFETPDGPYLPDFRLKLYNRSVFFEVKPEADRGALVDKRWRHVACLGAGLYVAYGLPKIGRSIRVEDWGCDGFPPSDLGSRLARVWPNGELDAYQFFCECPYCYAVSIEWAGGLVEFVEEPGPYFGETGEQTWCTTGVGVFRCCAHKYEFGQVYHGGVKRIARAYDAARSARFEHGETGR
jgi:hypothetical protein